LVKTLVACGRRMFGGWRRRGECGRAVIDEAERQRLRLAGAM
jgi:hypothetical protein